MGLLAALVAAAATTTAAEPFLAYDRRDPSATEVEGLSFLHLIGSHFGVPDVPKAYDYVVVGGGTAGLTLATRLAENASITVAVIEAGGFYEFDNGNFSEIPGYASQFTRK